MLRGLEIWCVANDDIYPEDENPWNWEAIGGGMENWICGCERTSVIREETDFPERAYFPLDEMTTCEAVGLTNEVKGWKCARQECNTCLPAVGYVPLPGGTRDHVSERLDVAAAPRWDATLRTPAQKREQLMQWGAESPGSVFSLRPPHITLHESEPSASELASMEARAWSSVRSTVGCPYAAAARSGVLPRYRVRLLAAYRACRR